MNNYDVEKISVSKAGEEATNKENKEPVNNDFTSIIEELEKSISNVKDTYECDELIDKIQTLIQQFSEIKCRLYKKRQDKYEQMKTKNIKCIFEEVGKDTLLDHDYVFYLVKNDGTVSNRKKVKKIPDVFLGDDKLYFKQILDIEKSFSKEEATIICMEITKAREAYYVWNTEREIKREEKWKKLREKIREFDNIKDGFNMSEDMKIMTSHIVKNGYKQLAKQYHPDVSGDTGEAMKKLNVAKSKLDMIIGIKK